MTVTDVGGDQPAALEHLDRRAIFGDETAFAPARLASGDADRRRRTAGTRRRRARNVPDAMLVRAGADDDVGDVADIDRAIVPGRQQEKAYIGLADEGLTGDHGQAAAIAEAEVAVLYCSPGLRDGLLLFR